MVLRTFYNHVGVVTRIVYELPRHEEVHKDTKMKLVETNGSWYVVAEPLAKPGRGSEKQKPTFSERKIASSLAEDED